MSPNPKLVIHKMFDDAITPSKTHQTDSGFDLYVHRFIKSICGRNGLDFEQTYDEATRFVDKTMTLNPGDRVLIGTGIKAKVDVKDSSSLKLFQYNFDMVFELQIRPRSGTAFKRGLTIINSPGSVDVSFRGELLCALINHSNSPQTIEIGERIAQLVPAPVLLPTLEEDVILDETTRGAGGFNSTGTK